MRPDPHKRARSRQYKAKHGLFGNQHQSKQQSNLPSNISDESFSLFPDTEGITNNDWINFTFLEKLENECLNFDDNEFIPDNLNAPQNEQIFNYPKNLYTQIFPIDSSVKKLYGSVNDILSIEFSSAENDSASFLRLKIDSDSNHQSTMGNIKLELKKIDNLVVTKANVTNSNLSKSAEKLALENWLDDVL